MYTGSELDMTLGRLISVSPTLVCSMFIDCCCSFEQVSWLPRGVYWQSDWEFERAS